MRLVSAALILLVLASGCALGLLAGLWLVGALHTLQ